MPSRSSQLMCMVCTSVWTHARCRTTHLVLGSPHARGTEKNTKIHRQVMYTFQNIKTHLNICDNYNHALRIPHQTTSIPVVRLDHTDCQYPNPGPDGVDIKDTG
ncbi:hypothetical protein C8Q74DRAFT_1288254 [Fomes fomentarius]|nr:hypothetical protein C8Q74DRAFT_1288254 [Fomes fomentarius]